MKFAKIIFRVAGIWGVLTLTPLYFMFNLIGQKDPPPITHPAFFYGFVGAALFAILQRGDVLGEEKDRPPNLPTQKRQPPHP